MNKIFKLSLITTFLSFASLTYASNWNNSNGLIWNNPNGENIQNNFNDIDIDIDIHHGCLRHTYEKMEEPKEINQVVIIEPPPTIYIMQPIVIPTPHEPVKISTQHFYTAFFFKPGQYKLSDNHAHKAKLLKDFLHQTNTNKDLKEIQSIHITSYTDSTGDPYFNRRLALQRALSIKHFLLSAGIPKEKISFTSLTSNVPEKTQEEQDNNRMVFIDITFVN